MEGLVANYGSSDDEDRGSDDGDARAPELEAPSAPAPARAPSAALPSAASILAGPPRPPSAALPSAVAALAAGPARPPPPGDDAFRPAKKQRVAPGASSARAAKPRLPAMLAPPQLRRPNISTEAVGTWNSKATTDKFERQQRASQRRPS